MQNTSKHGFRALLLAVLALASGLADAHPGHGAAGVVAGLVHPLGADHLLAMGAVGFWSVTALPGAKIWRGPAAFMLCLVLGAFVGASGVALPYAAHLTALSVVLFGLMLALTRLDLPPAAGFSLIALAGAVHGLSHGADMPAGNYTGYAAGFLLTTALLHGCGICVGLTLRQALARHAKAITASIGVVLSIAGICLLQQA